MSETHSAYGALQWDLSDRLSKALRVSGKSRKQIAAELGVHENTITNYTRGRIPPDRRTLMAWAMATGVPLPWLESGLASEDPHNPEPDPGISEAAETRIARLAASKRATAPYVAGAFDDFPTRVAA